MSTSYCLGCDKFKSLTIYYVLPNNKHYNFSLCFTCKDKLKMIVANAELQAGDWKEPMQLEIPSYFHLLKDFIMGESK